MQENRNERPYPLRNRVLRIVFPLLLASVISYMFSASAQFSDLAEKVYIGLEKSRMYEIMRDLKDEHPDIYGILQESLNSTSSLDSQAQSLIQDNMNREAAMRGDICLAYYSPNGEMVVRSVPDSTCGVIDADLISTVARSGSGQLIEDFPGLGVWTVVVPLEFDSDELVVAAISKHAQGIEYSISEYFYAWVSLSLAGFLIASVFGWVFISHAQRKIDNQVQKLIALRKELSHYLSIETIRAAEGLESNATGARRVTKTLLFMDVRDFSGYADSADPDDIVALMSDVVSISTSVIARHKGDVDKIIGDGLLATFGGSDRQSRALGAAFEILREVRARGFPRGIGIGIHDGEVVSAALGSGERRDYTVLGRSVNQASRLCSIADAGQVVASARVVDAAPQFDRLFGPIGSVVLKGHAGVIAIRVLNMDATST